MLILKNINKIYITNNQKQKALDDLSINFRKCEFASILGPSGSGKTTLLNIIGGLDSYDSGNLIINGISTKKYKDKNWDSYRNHQIGFVFQSYNLISHQTILKNVELALTLSGVSKKQRIIRAKEVLNKVGLSHHINKKPNQLSGGQMQRVAIARALVNNPNILLLDEPTGALDSITSKQIMELLKEIAHDKLIIMVTHNPELAKEYSNRIIELKDGKITNDSNPFNDSEIIAKKIKQEKTSSMSLLTALSLSLNNLLTKKGRTILTAFAGSIGIIGIALILSLSNGVKEYIDKTQKETLATYPLAIEKQATDLTSMVDDHISLNNKITCKENEICTIDDITTNPSLKISSLTKENNLSKLKDKFDNNYENINNYITDIQYNYDLDLQIFSNINNKPIKVNPNSLNLLNNISSPFISSNNIFKEMIDNSELLNNQYDILEGHMPNKYNEVVLVVDENSQIPISVLYSLNIKNREELTNIVNKISAGEKVSLSQNNYTYKQLVGTKYKLILNTDYYAKENNNWVDKSSDEAYMKRIVDNGMDITISGIVKISKEAVEASSGYVGYTKELTKYVISEINKQEIVSEQINNNKINIITNQLFTEENTYEDNLKKLGINSENDPSSINIYPINYESKDKIKEIINKYNNSQKEIDKITYNDYVGMLMTSVTSIINIITYILVAFVAISLVVSSIMIAIITYISVLERTKEIGILRAIGASKKDINRVFKAETIIEGLIAGVLGIVITILLCIPINIIISNSLDIDNIAVLPLYGAIILIIISVLLTVIAGLIPSKIASKKDPVEALRTE